MEWDMIDRLEELKQKIIDKERLYRRKDFFYTKRRRYDEKLREDEVLFIGNKLMEYFNNTLHLTIHDNITPEQSHMIEAAYHNFISDDDTFQNSCILPLEHIIELYEFCEQNDEFHEKYDDIINLYLRICLKEKDFSKSAQKLISIATIGFKELSKYISRDKNLKEMIDNALSERIVTQKFLHNIHQFLEISCFF